MKITPTIPLLFVFLITIFTASYVSADDEKEPEKKAPIPKVPLDTIYDVLVHDWDEDGEDDRAFIIQTEEGTDLLVLFASGKWERKRDIALNHPRCTILSLNRAGSLVISSSNCGIGRQNWQKRLTLAFRGGKLVVAGLVYQSDDKFFEYPEVNFEANYLTGKTIRDGKTTKGKARKIPLAEWEEPKLD